MSEETEQYLTFTEAADYLGISLVTLRERVKKGWLTPKTNPLDTRQKLIAVSELTALLTQQGIKLADTAPILERKRTARAGAGATDSKNNPAPDQVAPASATPDRAGQATPATPPPIPDPQPGQQRPHPTRPAKRSGAPDCWLFEQEAEIPPLGPYTRQQAEELLIRFQQAGTKLRLFQAATTSEAHEQYRRLYVAILRGQDFW